MPALSFHNCNNLQLTGTRHLNSARNHISINNSNHTHIFNVTITAPQDSPNTDGIDVSQSSYILIQRSTIATGKRHWKHSRHSRPYIVMKIYASSYTNLKLNFILIGDDCIAMKSGTSYVNITGITCGPGHGIRYKYIFIMQIWFNQWKSVSSLFLLAMCSVLEALGKKELVKQWSMFM